MFMALSRRALVLASCAAVLHSGVIMAQDNDWTSRYEVRVYEHVDGSKLPYRWYFPKDVAPDSQVPLLIFLHGAGERGDDNQKTLVHGAKDFVSHTYQDGRPFAVLIPQCPEGDKWANVDWTADSHVLQEDPTPSLALLVQVLDNLMAEGRIDPKRVYVTGLSMGGFGTWDLLSRYPDRFAAAAPICGGGDPSPAVVRKFSKVPLWVFHGGKDEVVKPARSREMIEALEAIGAEPRYTEYPDAGHDSWTRTYANPEFADWLFSHRLGE